MNTKHLIIYTKVSYIYYHMLLKGDFFVETIYSSRKCYLEMSLN